LSPIWKSATTSLLIFAAASAAAVTPTEWQNRQTVVVATPGLAKLAPPAATFDAAQMSLADLRLLDGTGREVPYLLERDLISRGLEHAPAFPPKSFRTVPAGDTTQLVIETGTGGSLDALELETTVPYFLKAAHVDVSTDGTTWTSVGPAVPLFRQFGAEQLRLMLPRKATAFIRVTVDDFRSRPITFTGARLRPSPAQAAPPALTPVGAEITRREEFAGETVLTVTLDGKNVPLAELRLGAKDALFMRRVTVAIREVRGELSGERVVGAGTIYRLALAGEPEQAQLEVPLDFTPPTRELLVHIANGDSPPLAIDAVTARQHPVSLVFFAPAAGNYTLLSGNPQAVAPRYDLAAFAGDLRTASAAVLTPGALEAMPGYQPGNSLAAPPLPEIPLAGAPLATKDWTARKPIRISRAGVQELELDPEALAQSRNDGADLRVLRGGNQIPYVLEQPALARSLTLTATASPDPKRPRMSVWKLTLPQAGLPLRRIGLTSATPLFQREFRLYEKVTGPDGGAREHLLAAGAWSRTPEPGVAETKVFELGDRLQTDTAWIETDNGDNPAIALGAVTATYPVVRLIFKVAEPDGYLLAYGNPAATAPRYDLTLVAVRLLTASRNAAALEAGARNPDSPRNFLTGFNRRYVLWGALALVVVVLLVVVAKLLPKPPAA